MLSVSVLSLSTPSAAAIGIGFGSQNVLNNFISGLILLAEQPIRVGDMVEIEGFRLTALEVRGRRIGRVRIERTAVPVAPDVDD